MKDLLSTEDIEVLKKRYSILVWSSIGVMSIFVVLSIIDVFTMRNWRLVLNLLLDVGLTIILLRTRQLIDRVDLDKLAMMITIVIACYGVLNALIDPELVLRMIFMPYVAISSSVAYVSNQQLRFLSVVVWISSALIFWISTLSQTEQAILDFLAYWVAAGIILLIMLQFHRHLKEALAQRVAVNHSLQKANSSLEALVEERTHSLRVALNEAQLQTDEAQRFHAETETHRQAVRFLSTPILPVGYETLVVPLVGIFDQARLAIMHERILQQLEQQDRRYVVFDITGLTIVDDDIAEQILKTAQAVQYMGTQIILAGVRPELAQAIVSNESDLSELLTVTTLEEALEFVRKAQIE